jgi:phage terminase small subunit
VTVDTLLLEVHCARWDSYTKASTELTEKGGILQKKVETSPPLPGLPHLGHYLGHFDDF